jgi:hypothetical protein
MICHCCCCSPAVVSLTLTRRFFLSIRGFRWDRFPSSLVAGTGQALRLQAVLSVWTSARSAPLTPPPHPSQAAPLLLLLLLWIQPHQTTLRTQSRTSQQPKPQPTLRSSREPLPLQHMQPHLAAATAQQIQKASLYLLRLPPQPCVRPAMQHGIAFCRLQHWPPCCCCSHAAPAAPAL